MTMTTASLVIGGGGGRTTAAVLAQGGSGRETPRLAVVWARAWRRGRRAGQRKARAGGWLVFGVCQDGGPSSEPRQLAAYPINPSRSIQLPAEYLSSFDKRAREREGQKKTEGDEDKEA